MSEPFQASTKSRGRGPGRAGSKLDVRPLGSKVGAQIQGLDLGSSLSGSQVDFLHKTLLEHQVLCFPDQDLTPQDLLRLGRSFGAPQVNPIMGGIKEIPQVVRVEKRAGDSDIFTGRARLIGS